MSIRRQITLAIALVAGLMDVVLCGAWLLVTERHERAQYLDHLQTQLQVTGHMLRDLDAQQDVIAKNALAVLRQYDLEGPLPNNDALRALAATLHVSDFYATDKDGFFTRSTNGDPSLFRVRSLFEYCPEFRDLMDDPARCEHTPYVNASDLQRPGFYKYAMTSSLRGDAILEASISAEHVNQLLLEVLSDESTLQSLTFYTPYGDVLSSAGPGEPPSDKVRLATLNKPMWGSDTLTITRKVVATSPYCCECKNLSLKDADGYAYYLTANFSTRVIEQRLANLRWSASGVFLLVIVLSAIISKLVADRLVQRIERISRAVETIAEEDDLTVRLNMQGRDELAQLGRRIDMMSARLGESIVARVAAEREKAEGIELLAAQTCHDIWSPLAALDMVSRQQVNMPRKVHDVLVQAIERVRDIVNSLHDRSLINQVESTQTVLHMVVPLVEALVSEKRLEYRGRRRLRFEFAADAASLGTFAQLHRSDFRRVLSNLINNAVEAVGQDGEIRVVCTRDGDILHIAIIDDGHGIPADVLPMLGQRGASFLKPGGKGLGLYHAKQTLRGFGGELQLESQEGKGTTLTLSLPAAAPASWFPQVLQVPEHGLVVVLDDDEAIHGTWDQRLQPLGATIVHLRSSAEFDAWMAGAPPADTLMLLDHELHGSKESGIDLVLKHGLRGAVLVTSRYQESRVIERCVEHGIALLPKNAVNYIRIVGVERAQWQLSIKR